MATPSKLLASNGYYGYDSYSNSAANHLYVGGASSSTTYQYRSRLTFKPVSSIQGVGTNRIAISKIMLYLRRNGDGPTTITIGCSNSGNWDATLNATRTATISATSQWYAIDITSMAAYIGAYTSNWYIHLRNGTPRVRLNGTGSDYVPYIMVTWEYVAATITSNAETATLGSSIQFTITPEVSGETHTLTYSIGDQSGTIATKGGNAISWTPPLSLATEFPDDDTGTVQIRMTAYDSTGAVQRTETLYQAVTAPTGMKPNISSIGMTLLNGLSGYGLTGRSALSIAPTVSMEAAYGARLVNVTAKITNGDNVQELSWSAFSEDSPGVWTAAVQTSAILSNAGSVSVAVTATDSRGRTATSSSSATVIAYAPPQIALFSVERYEPIYDANETIIGSVPSDLGGHVWVNIYASVSEIKPLATQLNKLSWRIDGVNQRGQTIEVSGSGDQEVDITREKDLISDAVDEGDAWQYTLTVTDTAGAATMRYSFVQPAHAALSVSPDKYGLAIGMIANGTKSNPMFEVAENYKSVFYGGLQAPGVNDYSTNEVATGGTWIDGKPVYRRVMTVSAAANVFADVNDTPIEMDRLVSLRGCAYMKTANPYYTALPFSYYNSSGALTTHIFAYVQGGVVKIKGNVDFDAWIAIEYTK